LGVKVKKRNEVKQQIRLAAGAASKTPPAAMPVCASAMTIQ